MYTIDELEQKYRELEQELAKPDILSNKNRYAQITKEFDDISKILTETRRLIKLDQDIAEYREMLEAEDERALQSEINSEIERLKGERIDAEHKIMRVMMTEDPMSGKNIIMEIRAGSGGEEAALFAADLFRMYARYCDKKGWKVEHLSSHETGVGGFKEIIFSISGKEVYPKLKYEMGVHRVQRIPVTESQGRIHTSAVTVAVLPEAEETDVELLPDDLRVDVFRSTGHGGQSVNTTDSAVRITHLPTGVVVTCQDEKSQHKNKDKAMKVLRARLYEMHVREKKKVEDEERRNQVGSGDRSERIRTYNFPQNRVTDHRIGLTLYKLELIMEGELDELIESLVDFDARKNLNKVGEKKFR